MISDAMLNFKIESELQNFAEKHLISQTVH